MNRAGTYARLISVKKIGFIGALALLFNAATGPGLPFTPQTFQNPGYAFTTICFAFMAFISGFAILFIVEAMQAIPGNKHFQGEVEYATLINFYFEPLTHIAGQLLLYGALQSNSIQSFVLSAQVFIFYKAIDNLLIDVFGRTCGLAVHAGLICVAESGELPSPFGNQFMLMTLGFVIVLLLVIPLGLTNLDDNMWVQYGYHNLILVASILSIGLVLQWSSTSFLAGIKLTRIPAAVAIGSSYGSVVGTVMLNYAIITIIPSWINIKVVWASVSLIAVFYTVSGFILAAGYDMRSNNILSVLLQSGLPKILTKLTVYAFAFVMLIPAIPVNLIISRENLLQNQVLSARKSFFLSFFLPILTCIPFQTGTLIQPFQIWSSLIFVSTSNYIIPVLIYFKCLRFRQQYNTDRILSPKQLDILKRIHSKSQSLVNHIDKKIDLLIVVNGSDNDMILGPVVQLTPHTSTEIRTFEDTIQTQSQQKGNLAIDFAIIDHDVPDPDMEDYLNGRLRPVGLESTVFERMARTMERRASSIPRAYTENILESPMSKIYSPATPNPIKFSTPPEGTTQSIARDDTLSTLQILDKQTKIDYPFLDIPTPSNRNSHLSDTNNSGRFKTLPTNPHFRTPAFRSVPSWMPIRGVHMAWVVLLITCVITVLNIIINLIPT